MDPDPTLNSASKNSAPNQFFIDDLIMANNTELESPVEDPMDLEPSCETPLVELPSDKMFNSRLDQVSHKRRAEEVATVMGKLDLEGAPCKKLKVDNAICSLVNNIGIDEISKNLKVLILCDLSLSSKAELLNIKSNLEGLVNELKNSLSITGESVYFNGIAYERNKVLSTLEKVGLVIKSIEINLLPVELTTHPAFIKKATQIAIEAGFARIHKDLEFKEDFLQFAVREFLHNYLKTQKFTYLCRPCSSVTRQKVTIKPQVLNFSYDTPGSFENSIAKVDSAYKEKMIDCSFFVLSTFESYNNALTHRVFAYNMDSVEPEYYFFPNDGNKVVNYEKFNSFQEIIAASGLPLKPYNFTATVYDGYSMSLSRLTDSWMNSK